MSYTVQDFVDALDTQAFIAMFARLGFRPVPHAEGLYLREVDFDRDGRRRHRLRQTVRFDSPDAILAAARTYTELTGLRLWWLPQTEQEAMYASFLVNLLYLIRADIEDGDGGWNGADTVDLLCSWFRGLGLEVNAALPAQVTQQDFLPLALASAATYFSDDLDNAPPF